MSALVYRAYLRAGTEFKSLTRKSFRGWLSPFVDREHRPLLLHACYHKVGTVWFGRILREVAAEFGMSFRSGDNYDVIHRFETQGDADVFFDSGSHIDCATLPFRYKASHMIRDPRDIVVSGYFYHRWTDEQWANLPRAEYRGRTYRQYLNSVPKEEGIAAEIRRNSFWIPHMCRWDYTNSNVFEIRYEDIVQNEGLVFRRLFQHYEFRDECVDTALAIVRKYSFANMRAKGDAGEATHLRSGQAGEWRQHFSEQHIALFKGLYPGSLAKLGYEKDDTWS